MFDWLGGLFRKALFLVFLLLKRPKVRVSIGHVGVFVLVLAISGGWWYAAQVLNGNFGTVQDFITYQAGLLIDDFAGHGGFPGYHFIVMLIGVFPSSVIFLSGIITMKEEARSMEFANSR